MLETDRLDLLLDDDGDLALGVDFDLQFSTGLAAVAQACRIALLLVRGEWFADLGLGVPYFEREGVTAAEALMGQKFNKAKATSAFREALEGVDGVVSVVSIAVTFNSVTREMTVTWVVRTEFGDTPADSLSTGV